ncbi:hypothetical protein O1Q96_37595 [Streptomyces sp. Qhu-G9]|uniref:hypothetical protein n=1 Tax=Streptomyces sp. Qhu-G9 TaxID=3452799 RepID=UPI0022AC73D0|nr:hypothetical protein [Streptomyces aurantiacus]WAU84909.1 hypothetical protein O1Q96_37595 [Streptomyces aurantiacus]
MVASEAVQNTKAKTPVTATQNRSRQIRSSIKRLSEENLALRNVGDPKNPFPLMLLHESGSSEEEKYGYVIPDTYEGPPSIVSLPYFFFTRGWVYLLTDSEIRMYLILKHLAGRFPREHEERGIYCTERDREWLYAISRDVYESHLALARFGLIELIENPIRHKDGKVVNFDSFLKKGGLISPHRFRVLDDQVLLDEPGPKIRRALLNFPPSRAQMVNRKTQVDARN